MQLPTNATTLRIHIDETAAVQIQFAIVAISRFALRIFCVADVFAFGADEIDEGVLFAIHTDLDEFEIMAGRFALDPQLVSGSAPEGGDAGLKAFLKGFVVRVGDEDDFFSIGVLHGDGNDARATGGYLSQLAEIQFELVALFELDCFFFGHFNFCCEQTLRTEISIS